MLDNPLSYIYHRLRVFQNVLGLTKTVTTDLIFSPVWHLRLDATGADVPIAPRQSAIADVLDWIAINTPLFRPYLYFALALVLLPLVRRHRDLLALVASGVVYELTLVPFAPSPEYRYSHWMIVCTIIAIVILIRRSRLLAHADHD